MQSFLFPTTVEGTTLFGVMQLSIQQQYSSSIFYVHKRCFFFLNQPEDEIGMVGPVLQVVFKEDYRID